MGDDKLAGKGHVDDLSYFILFFLRRKKRRETVNSYSERNPE